MSRFFVCFCLFSAAVLALTFGCSDSDSGTNSNGGATVDTTTIGPSGGTISYAGKAWLDIPPGALPGTVNFTITDNSSPEALNSGTFGFISDCITIEPSGTVFSSPATLTLDYNPSLQGTGDETDIKIYADHGSGWAEETTTLDTAQNKASIEVSTLSDFACVADTAVPPAEGVYAKLVVGRSLTYFGGDEPIRIDLIDASFDSSYAPCDPVNPIGPVSVMCNAYTLTWNAGMGMHTYPETPGMNQFIQLGESYQFTVQAGGGVPYLQTSITFPSSEPYIVSPTYQQVVSKASGFTISWANSGTGNVELIMVGMSGDSALFVTTPNDGSYSVTSGDLSGIDTGMYSLILNYYNLSNISAAGYDSRSFIAGRVMHTTIITLQ